MADHHDSENAHAGTSALGSRASFAERLHGGCERPSGPRGATPAAELVVIDLIAEHNVEADEELAGERYSRLGTAAAMQDGEVAAAKIVVGARREGA